MFPAVATIPLFIEDELFLFEGNEPLLLLFADDDGVERFVAELLVLFFPPLVLLYNLASDGLFIIGVPSGRVGQEDVLFVLADDAPFLLFADDDGVERFVVELLGFCPVADAASEIKFLTAFPRLSKVDPELWLSVVLFEFALYVGVVVALFETVLPSVTAVLVVLPPVEVAALAGVGDTFADDVVVLGLLLVEGLLEPVPVTDVTTLTTLFTVAAIFFAGV